MKHLARPLLHIFDQARERVAATKPGIEGEEAMSVQKRFTTLGELIVAVTDEVAPIAADQRTTNALVSYILQDLFLKRRIRLRKPAILKRMG